MARINIEDSLYKDARFINLCIKLGSIETAIGALVRVWTVAQRCYLKDDRKIPLSVWKKQQLNDEVLACGLAIEDGGRISVNGADEQFKWLLQRSEAGSKGGKTKQKIQKNIDEKLDNNDQAVVNGRLTTDIRPQTVAKPLSLSLSLSPSLNTTTAVVGGDQKFEETKTSKPKNSTEAFNDRFLHQEYFEILKTWDLDFPTFKNNIGKIKERFSTTEKFTEFLKSVCSNKTYKDMKSKNDRAGCDRYLSRTLKSEMGLK